MTRFLRSRSARLSGAVAGCLLLVGAVGTTLGGAATYASQTASGTAGYCKTDDGVTVVVDFQELGGGIVVRCAPGPIGSDYSGIDALQDAGFSVEGVQRFGLAFVCRIAGKPAPDQDLPIHGDPDYHEACVNTPPPTAFWGYWYAPNDGTWTYSHTSALTRDVKAGGFEGWSFSLNHTESTAPPPGIAPHRPAPPPPTTPPPTSQRPTHPPTSKPTHGPTPPPSTPPTTSSTAAGLPPSTGSATRSGRVQPPNRHQRGPSQKHHRQQGTGAYESTLSITRSTASTSQDPVSAGHNEVGRTVSGQLPNAGSDDGGSPTVTVLAVLAVAALLAAAGVVGYRRRVRRE